MERYPLYLKLVGFICITTLGTIIHIYKQPSIVIEPRIETKRIDDIKKEPIKEEMVVVYISGAVQHPGVYKLKNGSRLSHLLKKAKLHPSASVEMINLSKTIHDTQHIHIPYKKITQNQVQVQKSCVSVKTGTKQELESLPSIGSKIAQRIIDYRNKNSITTNTDLKKVRGIGEQSYKKIYPYLCQT